MIGAHIGVPGMCGGSRHSPVFFATGRFGVRLFFLAVRGTAFVVAFATLSLLGCAIASLWRRWVDSQFKWTLIGAVLLTGTGLVPPDDVALAPGHDVEITIPGIGTLRNPVAAAAELLPERRSELHV